SESRAVCPTGRRPDVGRRMGTVPGNRRWRRVHCVEVDWNWFLCVRRSKSRSIRSACGGPHDCKYLGAFFVDRYCRRRLLFDGERRREVCGGGSEPGGLCAVGGGSHSCKYLGDFYVGGSQGRC